MLNKTKIYFLLQAVCIAVLLLCQSVWLVSRSAEAEVVRFYTDRDYNYNDMDFVVVTYTANNKQYTHRFPGDALDHHIHTLRIRYLTWLPGVVRVDNVGGNWMFYLVIYSIWWVGTSLLFFIPNGIVPAGACFSISRRFPWLQMQAR